MSMSRITGLASGMDTESIISELMKAARIPLDKLEQDKTTVQWQRETMLDVNSKMLDFQKAAFDMKLKGTYKVYNSETSDKTAVTATANTEAIEGIYRISASQLATTSKLEGSNINTTISSSSFILKSELDFRGKEMYVTLDGKQEKVVFGPDEGNLTTLATSTEVKNKLTELLSNKINNAFGSEQINVNVAIVSNKFRVNFSSKSALNLPIGFKSGDENDALEVLNIESGANNVFDTGIKVKDFMNPSTVFVDGKMNLTINGKNFQFDQEQTLSEVFKTISNDEDIDTLMKYDRIANKIIMTRKSSGGGRGITVSDDVGFFTELGLSSDYGTFTAGQNAIVSITDPEGRTIQNVQMTSNNFTFQGVSFTVLKEDTEATISVSKDVDAVYEKILKFTDKFNDLLGTLNTLYNEEKNREYAPLTDEEREALSDSQEEKWEKLAKQGILRRDSTLQNTISQMRQAVVGIINTDGAKSLFEIGINTTPYDAVNPVNNGKIVINEDKLKEAIRNNTDTLANLFTSTPNNIEGNLFEKGQILNLTGKSMQIQFNGSAKTIEFTRDYDLSISEDKDEFEEYMNSQLVKYFGAGNMSASVSSGRFILTSIRKGSITLNSGGEGIDALTELGVNDGAKYDTTQRGFATKIYDVMSTAMASITERAGSNSTAVDDSILGQKVKRLNEYISKQESKLETLENRYYAQFAAMEQAISNMNSQSNYIANMLGNQ